MKLRVVVVTLSSVVLTCVLQATCSGVDPCLRVVYTSTQFC